MIKPSIEEVLRDNQNGFRLGRSTTSHILALKRIIEGAKDRNLKSTMVFIDFKKAFDSEHRGLFTKILKAYGLLEILVEFADDVAAITDTIEGAKLFIDRLEIAAQSVGQVMNCSNTKFMNLNIPEEESILVDRNQREKVNDSVYLEACIATTERDLTVRKVKGWAACHKLKKIWKSG